MEIVVERVENERKDAKLDDYHKGILEELDEGLDKVVPELEQLESRVEEDHQLIDEITEKLDECGELATSMQLEKHVELIKLIERLDTEEANTLEMAYAVDDQLNKMVELLNEIDTDQANDTNVQRLKAISVDADKLMQNLKFIRSVFDSTDGYTSSEEEDKTYGDISTDLGVLIQNLKDVLDKVGKYKAAANFENIDEFADTVTKEISEIEKSLDQHSEVLQNIEWKVKLEHRVEELKESLKDHEDIVSDGEKVLEDLKKLKTAAEKNPEANEELIETIDSHI